jgi:hypothetical protein
MSAILKVADGQVIMTEYTLRVDGAIIDASNDHDRLNSFRVKAISSLVWKRPCMA